MKNAELNLIQRVQGNVSTICFTKKINKSEVYKKKIKRKTILLFLHAFADALIKKF